MSKRIDTKAVDLETLDFLVEHADWFSRLRRLQDAGNYANDDGEQLLDNIGFRSIVEMTSHLACTRNALAQEIADREALERDAAPFAAQIAQRKTYTVTEDNTSALAAGQKRHGGPPMTLREIMEQEEKS